MKHVYLLALTCCFFFNIPLAQQPSKLIHLKNGYIDKGKNLLNKKITNQAFRYARFDKKYFVLVQFDKLPGVAERNELSSRGILLCDYLPANAYLTEVR